MHTKWLSGISCQTKEEAAFSLVQDPRNAYNQEEATCRAQKRTSKLIFQIYLFAFLQSHQLFQHLRE